MLSAIIVNFRSSDLVNDRLRSLLGGNRPPDQVVVVDDEGTDGGLAPEFAADPRVRWAIELMFMLQSARLDAVDRLART